MREGPENLSRRKFLAGAGGVMGAMAMGAESVEAQDMSETEKERTDTMRALVTDLLREALPLLRQINLADTNRYSSYVERFIAGEVVKPGDHALRRTFEEIYHLYADYENGSKLPSNEARMYAKQVIDSLAALLSRNMRTIEAAGLRADYDRLRKKIMETNNKYREIILKW